jgi:dihydroflavonol-4-reductase
MEKQVLVTGGTGFIGRHAVRNLLETGRRVRVLTRRPQEAVRILGPDIAVVSGDLCSAEAVRAAVRGVSAIIHGGGLYRFGPTHRAHLWQTNVLGTAHLLEAAFAEGVERVVHVSSAGVLSGPRLPLREDAFPPPPFCGLHYKNSKWHAEQLALQWAQKGLNVVIASPTCPIGPEDESPTPTGAILRDFLSGHFPCVTRTGLNFIDVRDVASGLVRLLEKGQCGQRYLLSHQNLSLPQFLQRLASLTDRSPPRFTVPWSLIFCAGAVTELLGRFFPSLAERLCFETACQCRRQQFFDNSRTRAELEWEPQIPFDQTLREAIAWFQSNPVSSRQEVSR